MRVGFLGNTGLVFFLCLLASSQEEQEGFQYYNLSTSSLGTIHVGVQIPQFFCGIVFAGRTVVHWVEYFSKNSTR